MVRRLALPFVAFTVVALACSKPKRAENDPPPSVRAVSNPCYEKEPVQDRVSLVNGMEAPGLQLWKVCPCKPQICFVVGSDEKDQLVKSEEVLVRLFDKHVSDSAILDARVSLDVLGAPKSTPERIERSAWQGRTLAFLTAGWDEDVRAQRCKSYEVDVGKKKVTKTDVTDKYGADCAKARRE